MLDKPTWGDAVLDTPITNKHIRAVIGNRSHDSNNPDTEEFKILGVVRKVSSPGPHERKL